MSVGQAGCRLSRIGWRAALAAAACLEPRAACADLWSLDASAESRLEFNDNVALSTRSAGSVTTLALSTSVAAARRVESAATRLSADLAALRQSGSGAEDRIDGRLQLSQSFIHLRDSFSFSATLAQDFNSDVINADVTQPRGRRRTSALSGSWSRAFSERLSGSVQSAVSRAGYGQASSEATDFRNASVSASLSYRLSEIRSATVQASHSEYRTASGGNRSSTDSVDAGLSQAFSESASGSLNVGTYRTRSASALLRLACPLQITLCQAGLVPFILVPDTFLSSRRGLQYNASARWQIDEASSAAFSAARQQAPSGAGTVVRSDTLSLSVDRAFSPTVSGSAGYGWSRSSLPDATAAPSAGQQSLSLSLSRQLTPDLSLQAGARHTRAEGSAAGNGARSNAIYVSLKYDWARIEASR